jgi:hypothetical protein
MIQFSKRIGPANLGVHIDFIIGYVDLHLPFIILTFGNTKEVCYPHDWHNSSRDIKTGVKFDGH